ncbi:MAG TPA: cytochrome b/b6 domain-containing protein [Burkholderiales bacterium]|nr:cytochrome b/b6 domain-containing protein [Burkholderiales bacterium]
MSREERVLVWDPLVRVFHWLLVAAFFAAYLIEPEESELHFLAGYAVLALILVRIVWGFVGSAHARFSDFTYSPGAILAYLGNAIRMRAQRYLGHSPGGGAMVIVLLLMLLATTASGLMVYGADQHAGPLAQWMSAVSEEGEHLLEEVHELLANVTLGLVILHILGVLLASYSHHENLVKAMFTGYKRRQ